MNINKLAKKLDIKDLSVEAQSLSNSDTIVGADNYSVSTSYSYSYSSSSGGYSYSSSYSFSSSFSTSYAFNQPANQFPEEEPKYAYAFGGTYNPWRKR